MDPVDGNASFIALEHKILDFWKENDCFNGLREKNQNGPIFRFLDGPITANNPMGVHHAWGRTLKDVFLRRKAMLGFKCNWQNGFDSQGLWVEVEVERELGFGSKKDIEESGIENFILKCKERVAKYSGVITQQSIRLGQWMDWDNSYFTHTDTNIAGIWHFLQTCHRNGWVYQDYRILPWCPRCGTSLSEHEMAGSHRDLEHLAVYVKLPLIGKPGRVVVWTTTPWTLPANVAIAVAPDIDYCEVLIEGSDEPLIIAQKSLGILKDRKPKVQRVFKGQELIGLEYETCFPDLPAQQNIVHRIIPWEEVDPEEGSGLVHIAPGCGAEDYELSKQQDLPIIEPVNEYGIYHENFGWFTGKDSREVAQPVIEQLEAAGKLLKSAPYTHSYPVCWRCKTETIFRLVKEWFIKSDNVRPRMLRAAQTVRWSPEHMLGRMQDWLNNMGDWNISRKRFYGLPLPFYPCACGHLTVIGSKEELLSLSGAAPDLLPELHRPWIDQVKIRCPQCNTEVARIPEVGDVWLDAGIVPYSTLGYFTDRDRWQKYYPAEWIVEMREQIRLWFYSMLFMGVTLFDHSPYESVLCHESVVSEEGTRFSKTGFMIHFNEAVEQMGADVMRYLFCSSNVGNRVRFGYTSGNDVRRKLLTYWNVYSFFVTYARLDRPDLSREVSLDQLTVTDRWVLARTAQFQRTFSAAMDAYSTPEAIREFESYVDDLSTWYVRVNRRRFWKSKESEDKRVAYWCLYQAIRVMTQLMAPIIPFMTEEIWQNCVRSLRADEAVSVHLSESPNENSNWNDDELIAHTEVVRNLISLAQRLRKQEQIKVRQPLAALYIVADAAKQGAVDRMRSIIAEEVNVKSVTTLQGLDELQTPYLTLDFKKAGPILKGDVQKVKAVFEALNEEQLQAALEQYRSNSPVVLPGWDAPLDRAVFAEQMRPREGMVVMTEGEVTVALDTRLTRELILEGLARDVVRQIQVLRKDSGMLVDQRIKLKIQTDSDVLRSAVAEYEKYITEETLTDSIDLPDDAVAGSRDIEISGHHAQVALGAV